MFALGSIILFAGIAIGIILCCADVVKAGIITLVISVFIAIPLIVFGMQSNSFKRFEKDFKSNYSDGIDRTILITAEDGRIIYEYEGTVDIEIDENLRKIKFEDDNGKRQIIIYGVQDTVQIIEK
jgi:hypothetical protein